MVGESSRKAIREMRCGDHHYEFANIIIYVETAWGMLNHGLAPRLQLCTPMLNMKKLRITPSMQH